MGAHSHPDMYNLPRGTVKAIAWKFRLSPQVVATLRARFYLFDALELEALVAAHCKLSKLHRGYLSRQSFPDLHPPRPLHMQHSHYQ